MPFPLPQGDLTPGGEWRAFSGVGEGIVRSLDWLSTDSFALGQGAPTRFQGNLLGEIRNSFLVTTAWMGVNVSHISPHDSWNQKHVNSNRGEVHVGLGEH